MKTKKVVIASQSKHKIAEIKHYFFAEKSLNNCFNFESLDNYTNKSIKETGSSFIENAIIKAQFASKISGKGALADDSGLCVPILNGQPGIFSARYGPKILGTKNQDELNNLHLLEQLKNYPKKQQRKAYYVAVLVWLRHLSDPNPLIVEANWHGEILKKPIGSNGFGYDPLFYISSLNRTAGELSLVEKNKFSHRAQALSKLKKQLVELNEVVSHR